MTLIERITDILLRPRQAWERIDHEPGEPGPLYTRYLMLLAAVPAVCGFIGMSLVGMGGFGMTIRIPVATGLVNAVVSYVLSLAGVFVLALVIDALAPTFGGVRSRGQALKVAVYASTAAMLGGVFGLLPSLAVLGLLAALYSVYLLYMGLPVLMRSPAQRAVPYTAAVVVAAIVLGVVMGAVMSLVVPRGASPLVGAAGAPGITIDTPSGRVTVNESGLQEAGRQMQEAARRMEEAQKSGGDSAAMGAAVQQAMSAATGEAGKGALALNPTALRAALPDTLGGRERTSLDLQNSAALGVATSQVAAQYGTDERAVQVQIIDMGAFGALAQLAGMVQGEHESDGNVDKTWKEGSRTLQQSYAKDGSHAEMHVFFQNGVMVNVEAEQTSIADVQAMVGQIDLARLEALQRPAKP